MCVHFNIAVTHRAECVYTSTQTGWNVCTFQRSRHSQGGMCVHFNTNGGGMCVHFNIAVTYRVECCGAYIST